MQDDTTITDDASGQQQLITDALRSITERRAVIEQAKGMLMLVYGVDADEAFDVLRKQSQDNNVKLNLVAEQVMRDLVELARTKGPVRQLALGGLIDSANRRIRHGGSRQLERRNDGGAPTKELEQPPR